jgi:hypothetical protein
MLMASNTLDKIIQEALSGISGMLSGVGSGGSGWFINGVEIPVATWDENQEFDSHGQAIPSSAFKVSIEEEPMFMTAPESWSDNDESYSEQEIIKLEEAAEAGEVFKNALLQGMLKSTSKPKDEGRSKPVKKMENLRGEKPGFVMAEGTNWWSVDEKDPYWQTKEGHKEAMNLYGQKPAWVKEPSLEYNPKTGKYDPIEKEVFVDLKPTKRISL